MAQPGVRDPRRAATFIACAAMTALLTFGVRGSAPVHPNCGPGAGSCFEPHPTPGCEMEECCDIVCVIDPFCCEIQWDEACVLTAMIHCESGPVCGTGESCLVPHPDPGCAEEECCEIVCLVDPYCCGAAWDEICAGEALVLCSDRICDLECVAQASEEEDCREDVNGGCSPDPPQFTTIECGVVYCGTVWADGIRDSDWYELTVAQNTLIEWSVRSEFPSEISIMVGDCTDGFTLGALTYGGWCVFETATLSVGPGTYYLVVAPGTQFAPIYAGISCDDPTKGLSHLPMFGPEYLATVFCTPILVDCPWDLHPDGAIDVPDVLELLKEWGPNAGHRADFDASGAVDVMDLVEMIAHWGPCTSVLRPADRHR